MAIDERIRKVVIGVALVALLVACARFIPSGESPDTGRVRESDAPASGVEATGNQAYTRADGAALFVHVAGAVRRPGVYRIEGGARVREAIRRAGGPSRQADLDAINLAARVNDGQQVVVPRRAAAVGARGASPGGNAVGPVSLGTATPEQLDGLDGVGPAIAQKIVEWRTQHGGFGSVDDLDQVPGIGPKKLEALRAQLAP